MGSGRIDIVAPRHARGWPSYCVSSDETSRACASIDNDAPSAIVVGGDLAGMVVARELALRHWRVMLLEHATRLGGKYALGARGASAV